MSFELAYGFAYAFQGVWYNSFTYKEYCEKFLREKRWMGKMYTFHE